MPGNRIVPRGTQCAEGYYDCPYSRQLVETKKTANRKFIVSPLAGLAWSKGFNSCAEAFAIQVRCLSCRQAVMREMLSQIVWPVSSEHPCPYLADRMAREEFFLTRTFDPEDYHFLMDRGWRRSGFLFYRPCCQRCDECVPIRVATATFSPSRTQRRVWRHNQDLSVRVGKPRLTKEKVQLYSRYQRDWHDKAMDDSADALEAFLYESPVKTVEVCYRLDRRLVGAGILDVSRDAVSSVYFYFDPELHRRRLGVFSVLWEIEWCKRRRVSHYYLGYYVREASSMCYKTEYRPHELLDADGVWR